MRKIFFIIIAGLCLTSCSELDNIDFLNLKRDNPLDAKNNDNMKNGVALKFDSYSVVSDNNNDGIVNKGETVYLFVNIKNNGSSTANSVKAAFSTSSSYVTGFTPTTQVDYGDISAVSTQGYSGGQTNYVSGGGYYTVKFTVSSTTPANTKIPVNISITDENGNTWSDKFEVTVEATQAQIAYNSYSVVSDNNNDDIVNKGETIYLFVNLKNNGSSTANSVKATFSTSSSYVTGFTPTAQVNYGDISAGSTQGYSGGQTNYVSGGGYYTVKFTVSSTTPTNTKIPVNISLTDENGNTWSDKFEVTVEATQAQIAYNSYSVVSDNNNDKIINKGETVYLFVNLRNNGSSPANSVKATFSTSSLYITGFIPTTQVDYGNISANSTQGYSGGQTNYVSGGGYYTIKFTVSSSTPTNTKVPVSISMTDESNNTWSSSFNVTVQ